MITKFNIESVLFWRKLVERKRNTFTKLATKFKEIFKKAPTRYSWFLWKPLVWYKNQLSTSNVSHFPPSSSPGIAIQFWRKCVYHAPLSVQNWPPREPREVKDVDPSSLDGPYSPIYSSLGRDSASAAPSQRQPSRNRPYTTQPSTGRVWGLLDSTCEPCQGWQEC